MPLLPAGAPAIRGTSYVPHQLAHARESADTIYRHSRNVRQSFRTMQRRSETGKHGRIISRPSITYDIFDDSNPVCCHVQVHFDREHRYQFLPRVHPTLPTPKTTPFTTTTASCPITATTPTSSHPVSRWLRIIPSFNE